MFRQLVFIQFTLVLAAVATATSAAQVDQVERVRPAAVAGTWYPGDKAQLIAYVDNLLEGENHASGNGNGDGDGDSNGDDWHGPVRALISPHAGYQYSGSVAADGYRLVRGQSFSRVLLLGPAHHAGFHGLSIADVTDYETPLGRIPLDSDAIKRLRASGLVTADAQAHHREHSLEMQLPLLQRALQPGWQLVPVLVGQLEPDDYAAAAELLRPLLDDNTLVVVSSDFTHYGPRFGYRPFPNDKDTASRLVSLDSGSLGYILEKSPRGFLGYKARTGVTICGYEPVALLLHLLPEDSEGKLVSYATSGELTGDYQNSVSYLSIVFREPGNNTAIARQPGSMELSAEDMHLLHKLASAAVETAVGPENGAARQHLVQLLQDIPPELNAPAAAFVTLMNDGRVRGCMGSTANARPLYQVVVASGMYAARDRRFAPLRPEELDKLDVEISVLTRPESVDSYRDFVLGEEGVVLEKNGHNAIFLPEVPVKYNWSREQMLSRLAFKAGLPGDAWKNGASIKTFRTRSFSAPYAVTE